MRVGRIYDQQSWQKTEMVELREVRMKKRSGCRKSQDEETALPPHLVLSEEELDEEVGLNEAEGIDEAEGLNEEEGQGDEKGQGQGEEKGQDEEKG